MKNSVTLRFLALAAALAASALPAARAENKIPVVAFSPTQDSFFSQPFGRGATAAEVLLSLGEPDARLARGFWVYWHYQTNRAELNARGLDTLVIVFTDERVSGMKIVPHESIEPYLARVAALHAPARALAAK